MRYLSLKTSQLYVRYMTQIEVFEIMVYTTCIAFFGVKEFEFNNMDLRKKIKENKINLQKSVQYSTISCIELIVCSHCELLHG